MKQVIDKIYAAGEVTGRSGAIHKLHSEIDSQEGKFLYRIIEKDPSVIRTLEIGCGYGLSSLHICAAVSGRPGTAHTIIDPFQNSQWDGVGTKNLEDAGIDFFELVEMKSEFALPRLLEKKEGQYDFIFVDGWHTFDHALLDSFCATRLLRVGGYLTLDDANWPSVSRAASYLKNYPCYEVHDSLGDDWPNSQRKIAARALMSPVSSDTWKKVLHPSLYRRIFEKQSTRMIALKKVAEDKRSWDWHADAF